MKILVGIPCVTGPIHCRASIKSAISYADVLIIDNGATKEVKDVLLEIKDTYTTPYKLFTIVNKDNIYVNPAWNQIMEYFLEHKEYDYLIIMNSDLSMEFPWEWICNERWRNDPDEILVPVLNEGVKYPTYPYFLPAKIVTEGTPGAFITLNRRQAKIVYPIPGEIKIWFGDNWIYSTLRNFGYQTVIPPNLTGTTSWSQTVSKIPEATAIIEEDKIAWEKVKHTIKKPS